jgi:hypothetical protein
VVQTVTYLHSSDRLVKATQIVGSILRGLSTQPSQSYVSYMLTPLVGVEMPQYRFILAAFACKMLCVLSWICLSFVGDKKRLWLIGWSVRETGGKPKWWSDTASTHLHVSVDGWDVVSRFPTCRRSPTGFQGRSRRRRRQLRADVLNAGGPFNV